MVKNKKIFLLISVLVFLTLIYPVRALDEWWNDTWHYRVNLQINTTTYDRVDWPIEREMNFTEILKSFSVNGTFDINSTRVFEYNSTGHILNLVPSQFDIDEDYNASENAFGTLIFLLNGTTPPNKERYYYLYFDIIENGEKPKQSYSTDLSWSWDGQKFNVNNSVAYWWVDTNRGQGTNENETSGIYKTYQAGLPIFQEKSSNSRTLEYVQYSNGTHNFTFDLRNNAIFVNGSIRIKVIQVGNETFWGQLDNKTNQSTIVKEYYFYSKSPWIKIEQTIKNTDETTINRNSTVAGALTFDIGVYWSGDKYYNGNKSDPGSWAYAASWLGYSMGIMNMNETINDYYAINSSTLDKIGIQLDNISIPIGESVSQTAAIYFNGTSTDQSSTISFRNRIINPVSVNQSNEQLEVLTKTFTDYLIYNRGEGAFVFCNITEDTYNFTYYVNATIIPQTGSNETIILYDDGSHGDEFSGDKLYTNYFNFTSSGPLGTWTIVTKVYDITGYYLNESYASLNLTDIYKVNVNVTNPHGFPQRIVFANIFVQNFGGHQNVSNATINCSYKIDSTDVKLFNITDYLNGTYLLNFTVPEELGQYVLSCNATKDGNFGNNTDIFLVEPTKGYMNISVQPNNYTATTITWNVSESFDLAVNITNIGEGYVYSANITLQLPENTPLNWTANYTLYQCNDLYINESCWTDFNITVSEKTISGIYIVNTSAVWRNPDGTTNSTNTAITVNVTSNYLMEIPEDLVEGTVGGGMEKTIDNFTVRSVGNDPILDITFDVTGLADFNITFEPEGITEVNGSNNVTVFVNVSVPKGYIPGFYNGTINVTTANDGYKELAIEVTVSGTNMTIKIQPNNYTAENITWTVSDWFEISVNATNIGNGTAYDTNITIDLPQNTPLNWTANYTLYGCGDVNPLGDYCITGFNITVAERTPSGNYLINVTALWLDPETGNQWVNTTLNVTVTSNPILYILEDTISGNTTHGKETYLGNFTLESRGNDPLMNISYNISGLPISLAFELIQNVSSLAAGGNQTILVNVSIPSGYDPGTYPGTLNVTTDNTGFKNLSLIVTVPINRTWNTDKDYCEHPMTPEVGILCEVVVNNTGNVEVNITISPSQGNYTWVNETKFTVSKQSWHTLFVLYNVTGVSLHFNYSYYLIDANQTNAVPDNITLTVLLTPYVGPDIDIILIPDQTEQTGSIEIYANVTDRSGKGLQWVKVNVTRPGNLTDSRDMTYVGITGPNVTMWNATYPSNWGNNTPKGTYEILVYSLDNMTAFGNSTDTFLVYTKLLVTLSTGFDVYYQGETGSIHYWARDHAEDPLEGVDVNLSIKNPNNESIYILTGKSYTSDYQGLIDVGPFILPSDATTGNYTLSSQSSYFDTLISDSVNDSSSYSFEVRKKSELSGKVVIPVLQYVDQDLSISILTFKPNYIPTDPDEIELTVYWASEQFGLTEWFRLTKSNLTRVDEGYYVFSQHIDDGTNTGNYLAVLNVTKDGVTTGDITAFEIFQAGPFDVSINALTPEVPAGERLEIEINITNTGPTDNFDVNVSYWVEDGSVYMKNISVNVPAFSKITVENTYFDIFYDQSEGIYTLSVRVVYSDDFPSAEASTTFKVLPPVTTTTVPPRPPQEEEPAAPPGPPAPPMPGVGKIEIVKYPQEIIVERGWVNYPSVVVNNTGGVALRDIILSISGIPSSWYTIEPSEVDFLPVGDSAIFTIKLEVPITAEAKEYYGVLKAESSQASDEKMFVLLVFESRAELLDYEIKKLKKEIQDFESEVERAKEMGKDVSEVERLLEEAKNQVGLAENYYLRKMYDDALAAVFAARGLLDRAKYALSIAPYMKRVLIPLIPTWLMILLVVLAVVIVVLLIWLKKIRVDLTRIFRPGESEVKAAEEVKVTPEREALEAERNKVNRMLKLLETERKEGIITKKAYEELKFRNETKLKEIEEKLKGIK